MFLATIILFFSLTLSVAHDRSDRAPPPNAVGLIPAGCPLPKLRMSDEILPTHLRFGSPTSPPSLHRLGPPSLFPPDLLIAIL